MPKAPIPARLEAILSKPNPAVVATVRPDGQPVSVATWYAYENGRVLLNMDGGRKRLKYLRSDPRVSLTVFNGDDWSTHISVQGTVTEFADDTDLSGIDRLAQAYANIQYPDRERPRVNAWVTIDSWHVWGSLAEQS